MKKTSTIILQIIIVLIGVSTLVFMLLEPIFEGRNLHATLYQVYFNDTFLIYAYIASISFFVALYQIYKVLGYIKQNKMLSQENMKALRTIKCSAVTLICFVAVPLAYLFIVRPGDDIAGGVFMSLLVIFTSGIVAITATKFEKNLQSKSV